MPNEDSFQLANSSRRPYKDGEIDFKKILYRLTSIWYYFAIALILALICAYLYSKYMPPTYRVSATLLINEGKEGEVLGKNQYLEGLGLGAGAQNLDNQIMVLSSRTLIGSTLNELPFDIEYYYYSLNNKVSLYPYSPIKIVPETTDSLPRDIEFNIKYLDNNKFRLNAESNDLFDLATQASFGEVIKTSGGRFRIELSTGTWPEKNKDHEIKFMFHSRKKLVESYSRRVRVEKVSKTGTIVKVHLEGTNKTMNTEFLNKLTEIFLNNSLDKKNQEAVRTIQFIDDQLIGITDSLVITENQLQQFRSRNRVMNLSAQGQVIINQAMSLENQKARLGVEANYYNYLADYLVKDNIGQAPIAPATIGITDPGLTKLVADLADIQGQYYSKSLGEKNPLQSQLAQRLSNTKEALRETINGVRRSNNMAMNEINEQIRTVNAQASALPVTERQLLGIERKYKLNDELYTFLLEKRAGAQIQKASNMPDNEIVDPAEADSSPVKPKKLLVYVLAIMAGIGLPIFYILISDSFSTRIKEDEDVMRMTDISIIGHIPHSLIKNNTVLFDEPNSSSAEAFRSLRSRIQLYAKEIKIPVILMTSSMSEEGKTFSAINLASMYSLMGKKTVLVGFDLRKPYNYTDFGLENVKGVSTWLMGIDNLQDVIKETRHQNLFVIPAGPIPPNPYELTSLDKTAELLKLLKEMFDYIIIDSSPIGTVPDTSHLASLADICVLVVRQNKTSKDLLDRTLKDLKICDIKSLGLIMNDLGQGDKQYGYSEKWR